MNRFADREKRLAEEFRTKSDADAVLKGKCILQLKAIASEAKEYFNNKAIDLEGHVNETLDAPKLTLTVEGSSIEITSADLVNYSIRHKADNKGQLRDQSEHAGSEQALLDIITAFVDRVRGY